MQGISDILQFKQNKEVKKSPKYKFQETALEIIKLLRLEKKDHGLVWALYKRKGEQALNSLLGEVRQGEIKGEPIKYIKWLLINK